MASETPHRIGHKRRSIREWAGRIGLACGVAVLGYQSVIFSIAQANANSRPRFADAIVSYDGRLRAAYAASLMTPAITAVGRVQAEALSRVALRRDPTAVAAAATLGAVTLARSDNANARRLLAYAQMLSRRNVQTQLWSIEDAVGRGDITGALYWYDVALRTKPKMSGVLYPVLAQASRDASIRSALIRTLEKKPPWSDSYVSYVAEQKDDPQTAAALLVSLRARGVAIPAAAQVSVVNVLLDAGNVDQAWRYYATIRPGVDRSRARDPRFAAMLETPSAFDWTPLNEGGIAASIQRTHDGGTFEFSAPATIGGPALQQIQFLPSGSYRLTGRSDGIDQDAHALPYWTLKCRSDGQEIGRVTVPNSTKAGGMFEGTFMVPERCPVQILVFFVQPSDAIGGVSGQISRITLTPAK